nr:condensin-2 complex subunit D3-like [Procambarus clarkii]
MAEPGSDARMLLDLLAKFAVDKLDDAWIKKVIDADFTEVEDLPPEYEEHHYSTNLSGLFSAVVGCCRQWVDTLPPICADDTDRKLSVSSLAASEDTAKLSVSSLAASEDTAKLSVSSLAASEDTAIHTRFWIDLSEDVKGLMALLFYYSSRGQRYDAGEEDRELGIQAASLYFLLLCIPGSNAFRVFHPVMYLKTLDIMRLTTKLRVGASTHKKGRQGTVRGIQRKSYDEHLMVDADDDDEAEMAMLTPNEASKLIRSLNILLNDFLRFTQKFSLKHSAESLDETISILIDVSRCETNNAQGIFIGRHGPGTVAALAYNAYVALQSICNSIHGKVKKIVIIIMKHIMYSILMISRGLSDLSARSLGVIRDHSQIFVKYILTQIKQDAYDGVYILIQHLCIRVPDKAEFRQKTAQSVVEILRYLPIQLYTRLVKWFFKFSHNEKAGHRLFMLEVISKMLGEEERQAEGEAGTTKDGNQENFPKESEPKAVTERGSDNDDDEDEKEEGDKEISFLNVSIDHPGEIPPDRNILSHKFLLSIIFSRCRDSAATVRSKALALLADCTFSTNPTIMLAMKQIFFRSRPMFSTPRIPSNDLELESPLDLVEEEDLELPNAARVVSMLHRRALDDKVTVRKSALQVLENLMRLDNEMLSDKNLEVLAEHCRDPALLVRKQIITSLSTLVTCYPQHEAVITVWIKGVLPLILDPEIKVQERVVEVLDQLLFKRLLVHGHPQSETSENRLPWRILSIITKHSFHKFFNKALLMWSKSEYLRPQVMSIARTHIGKENNEEVWTLLALISNYVTVKDATFAVDYFEEQCQINSEVGSYTLLQVLKVLSNSIKHIPGNRAEALQQQLLEPLTNFSVGAELISHMMDTITLLSYSLHGDNMEGQKVIEKWAAPILKACDEHLKYVLFEKAEPLDSVGEEILFRYLFTLGEASMLCPQKVNNRMFLMLQSLIFHQPGEKSALTAVPSSQMHTSQPTMITFTPTIRVKALAVVTLGKMCLQQEDQAKRIIPAMGKMLDVTKYPALKINIVFTLSDMCVRYATLVDPLMPQVTACLRDPDINVRRTTLTLLINLLQEDYLKLRGSFFYRILQCLTDEHEDIRSTVVFYITERLLKRFPKILCQHFIECIFHYNCYEEHETYNRFTQSSVEKELFSLSGKEHLRERHTIYRFMLDHMPDDQRFTTTQRLCQDILGGIVNGRIKLTFTSQPMLEDTLTVLSSDEIKLASLKSRPEDIDQPTDQAEQAAMAGMVIKKTIISQVVKRNVIENIVPILIAVKHKLEKHRSPLMKHLLLYLKEIMRDYKNEVKEILAGDKQLAKEIEFDLRRLDQEQREEEEEEGNEKELAGGDEEGDNDLMQTDSQESAANGCQGSMGSSPNSEEQIDDPKSAANGCQGSMGSSPNSEEQIDDPKSAANGCQGSMGSSPNSEEQIDDPKSAANGCQGSMGSSPNSEEQIDDPKSAVNGCRGSLGSSPNSEEQIDDPKSAVNGCRGSLGSSPSSEEQIDNQESAAKGCQRSLDSSLALAAQMLIPNKTTSASSSLSVSKITPTSRKELHKQVVLKSKVLMAKRKRIVIRSCNFCGDGSHASSSMIEQQRENVSDLSKKGSERVMLKTPKNDKSYSRKKEEDKITHSPQNIKSREKWLRAISTPPAEISVISNITFVDETQASAISLDSTTSNINRQRDVTHPKLLLHLQKPETYAKNLDISCIRRSTRSLRSQIVKKISEAYGKDLDSNSIRRSTRSLSLEIAKKGRKSYANDSLLTYICQSPKISLISEMKKKKSTETYAKDLGLSRTQRSTRRSLSSETSKTSSKTYAKDSELCHICRPIKTSHFSEMKKKSPQAYAKDLDVSYTQRSTRRSFSSETSKTSPKAYTKDSALCHICRPTKTSFTSEMKKKSPQACAKDLDVSYSQRSTSRSLNSEASKESPKSFAKDSELSCIRRSTKRSLCSETANESAKSHTKDSDYKHIYHSINRSLNSKIIRKSLAVFIKDSNLNCTHHFTRRSFSKEITKTKKNIGVHEKDFDCNCVYRSTRRSLSSAKIKTSKDIPQKVQKSESHFESYSSVATGIVSKPDNSSSKSGASARYTHKRQKPETRSQCKRTRGMASLTPDPITTQAYREAAKSDRKRSKRSK